VKVIQKVSQEREHLDNAQIKSLQNYVSGE
jgi:hypothetical protein